jgi:hypothetical protein
MIAYRFEIAGRLAKKLGVGALFKAGKGRPETNHGNRDGTRVFVSAACDHVQRM